MTSDCRKEMTQRRKEVSENEKTKVKMGGLCEERLETGRSEEK